MARDGALLHVAGNLQVSNNDCTAHAEMVLVREASARFGPDALRGSTVFASGEPCAMCSGALYWAGVHRIVYAASNEAMARTLGGDLLPIRCADVLAGASRRIEVDGPVMREAAIAVLQEAAARTSN